MQQTVHGQNGLEQRVVRQGIQISGQRAAGADDGQPGALKRPYDLSGIIALVAGFSFGPSFKV